MGLGFAGARKEESANYPFNRQVYHEAALPPRETAGIALLG